MSKMIIGKYECGATKRSYFRKHKHYRNKRNGWRTIRWRMYIAHCIKQESSWNK